MGEVKTVVVWRLDRLARNHRDGINLLADWCEQGLVSSRKPLTSAAHRAACLLMGLAEMELEAIKERQAIGIAAAKKRGVYVDGRPKGSTKANPKRAIKLREQGIRPGEIAKILGVSRSTVYEYLAVSSRV